MEVPGPNSFTYKFYQTLEEEILQILSVWQTIEMSEHFQLNEFVKKKRWGGC